MMNLSTDMFCKLMAGYNKATLEQIYQAARECGVDPNDVTLGNLTNDIPVVVSDDPTYKTKSQPPKPKEERKTDLRVGKGGIEIDPRKEADRDTLDAIVLSSLSRAEDWLTMEQLDVYGSKGPETVVGLAEPLRTIHLRKALQRLVKRGLASTQGQARGTQYRLTSKGRGKSIAPGVIRRQRDKAA